MSSAELTSLSDERLLTLLSDLVRRERNTMLDVLLHLNEVERRTLHLKLGYSSLFAYCTGELGYSESAAGRRVQTARCVRKYPAISGMLQTGEVNLSTVTKIASILMSRGDTNLLNRIRGKSQRDVEAIVVELRPRSVLRDRVKPVCIRVPAEGGKVRAMALPVLGATAVHGSTPRSLSSVAPPASPTEASGANAVAAAPATHCTTRCDHSRSGSGAIPGGQESAGVDTGNVAGLVAGDEAPRAITQGAGAAMELEHKFMVQFVASGALMKKLDQVRALLSFKLAADASMEDVLDIVLGEYLDRNNPAKRWERRMKRQSRKAAGGPGDAGRDAPRRIPLATRDAVLERSGNRCSYVGANGRRCGAERYLQVDHVVPVARGGTGARSNLRVLCAAHNRLEAERIMGEGITARYARRE